jgi:3-phenylpropionate/trans-cinnamate dioxygenase ferredoxin component
VSASTWIPVCAPDEVEPEDVIPFVHVGSDYALYRAPDGSFYATDGHCTHERARLCDGLVMGTIIECPRHNGRFDYRTGEAKGAPAIVDLRTYPTRVQDGMVYVLVD